MSADIDRNLLFAVLALQAGLLDTEQFAQGCTLWASRKVTPLPDILVERALLTREQRVLVDRLLEAALQKQGGDARASLLAVTTDNAKPALAQVTDPTVEQSHADAPLGHS